MKRTLSHNLMAWFAVLALILSAHGQVHGYTWCVTEDGPARLETVAESPCNLAGNVVDHGELHVDGVVAALTADVDACGSCHHLAASLDSWQDRFRDGHGDLNLPLWSVVPQPHGTPVVVRLLTANLIPEPPPRIETRLLLHRTVVLLI